MRDPTRLTRDSACPSNRLELGLAEDLDDFDTLGRVRKSRTARGTGYESLEWYTAIREKEMAVVSEEPPNNTARLREAREKDGLCCETHLAGSEGV